MIWFIYLALVLFLLRMVYRMGLKSVTGIAPALRWVAEASTSSEGIQERVFPMLAYVGLLGILIKLTLF
ncbi:hypothetical protein [Algirhabdus cladophorae]|uniref:hypothetical protein n=1 Tax=Algirhabdus cladophorae TaxID=3377108 RepID=UPI003B847B45